MEWFLRKLARRLAPYIQQDIQDLLEPMAYGHTVTREMVEELAHDLDREITFDLQTGVVTIHKLEN